MNLDNNMIAPRLVSKKTIKKLGKIFQKPIINEPTWRDNLLSFYTENIKPNLFAIIIFICIFVYLMIKYLLKKEKDEFVKKDKINKIKKIILKKKLQKELENIQHIQNIQNAQINEIEPIVKKTKQNKKKKNKTKSLNDDIYYRANDIDIDSFDSFESQNEIEDDNQSYYSLSKNYENILKQNDGSLPVGFLQDEYEQKKAKLTFDELAKLVSGN